MPDIEQYETRLVFFVNGKKVVENEPDPEMTLLQYLRIKLRLCGTKLACAEGGCGACTAMVSKYDRFTNTILHYSINACLAPVCSMHGLAVTTVEGIGSTKTSLHPVQERIAKSHGSQCGFCTPGFVMSMYTLLRNNPQPSMEDLQLYFQGNLCRCTGYRPILEGFRTLTKEGCCGGSNANGCCKNSTNGAINGTSQEEDMKSELFDEKGFTPYDPSQEPIFPPELQLSNELDIQSLKFEGRRVTWLRPTNLSELVALKSKYPDAKIIVGNTEIGIEVKFKNCSYPILIAPTAIDELTDISYDSDTGLVVGAAISITAIENKIREVVNNEPEYKTRIFSAILEMLRWFSGKQIRNVGALGGNIVTASPISDLNPLLLAAAAELLVISSVGGLRKITMDHNFFIGYRKINMKPDEVLLSITIPNTKKDEYFYGFKQSTRREDDIAIVNAGMMVKIVGTRVDLARLAFGGMAAVPMMATKTAKGLIGSQWGEAVLESTFSLLAEDMPLDYNAPGGMVDYRGTLTTSFFFKFFLKVQLDLERAMGSGSGSSVPENYLSATSTFQRGPLKSSQVFQIVAPGQPIEDPVGRPVPHHSALEQATGEAVYCDDMHKMEGELHVAFVTSTRAHAKLVSIDAKPALAVAGVHHFLCSIDLPGERNITGAFFKEEVVFASEVVESHGQIIGAVVAEDKATAQRAAKLVKVEYEDLKPILTIEDAIAANSYFQKFNRTVKNGDVESGFEKADHLLEGEVRISGQEHFYMETQCASAVPTGEHDEMEVFLSTQVPHGSQIIISDALGIPANKVTIRTKRLGGGFGGKEHRSAMLAIPTVLAAKKLNRPVRYMLDRDEDMVITGHRHPFLARYKVGFTKEGRMTTLQISLYINAGRSVEVSFAVIDIALMKIDLAYKIPNVDLKGFCCRTNLSSNHAMRGFSMPQCILIMENIVGDIATFLQADPIMVRQINMYKEGDKTHCNHVLTKCTLPRCWEECLLQSDYRGRRKSVDTFNRDNRWKKRGLAATPMKYGCGFSLRHMCQGAALLNVYTDGSVLLTHGGVEMGQGLHIKLLQIASRVLGIPISKIHISETNTDKVPNAIITAGSASTDLFGGAVLEACKKIMARLEPIMAADPKGTWESWAKAAYMKEINLSAIGFYRQEGGGFDYNSLTGEPCWYYSYGAAVSEVEIDCLTGDHQVLRTDIVMDVGESLNPAIDIGQIEGAFIQGYGLYTLEELRYSPDGILYTRGPGTYKMPGVGDIPTEFNVSLLKGSPNPRAVYSSKAIGEPPLLLASSVFYAIKDAVNSARAHSGLTGIFRMDSPASAERIRMACKDALTKQFEDVKASEDSKKQPWSIVV